MGAQKYARAAVLVGVAAILFVAAFLFAYTAEPSQPVFAGGLVGGGVLFLGLAFAGGASQGRSDSRRNRP